MWEEVAVGQVAAVGQVVEEAPVHAALADVPAVQDVPVAAADPSVAAVAGAVVLLVGAEEVHLGVIVYRTAPDVGLSIT